MITLSRFISAVTGLTAPDLVKSWLSNTSSTSRTHLTLPPGSRGEGEGWEGWKGWESVEEEKWRGGGVEERSVGEERRGEGREEVKKTFPTMPMHQMNKSGSVV